MIASFRARARGARPAWLGSLRAGFATLALLSGMACGGNPVEAMPPEGMTDTTTPFSCTPGEALDCTCADGRVGQQQCLASGFEASGCMCGGDPTTTSDGTTSGADTTDTTDTTDTGADASTSTSSDTDEPLDASGTDESTGKGTDESTGESTGDTGGSTGDDSGGSSESTGSTGADDE